MPQTRFSVRTVMMLAAVLATGCRPSRTPALYSIRAGGAQARVEIAADPEARARGLSGRTTLADGQGMLFIFPRAAVVSFWMKDTYVPLSIAFITSDGQIAEIGEMEPESLESHMSPVAVTMVLEMPAGWFQRNGVKPGDAVVLPEQLKAVLAR